MKKNSLFIFFSTIFLSLLVLSCSNFETAKTTSINIKIPLKSIVENNSEQNPARAVDSEDIATNEDDSIYNIIITLNVDGQDIVQNARGTTEELSDKVFTFSDLLVGAVVFASCDILKDDNLIWTGKSESIVIFEGSNGIEITMEKVQQDEPPVDEPQQPEEPPVEEPQKPEEPPVDEPQKPEEPPVDEPQQPEEPPVDEPQQPEEPPVEEPQQPEEPPVEEPQKPEEPPVDEPQKPEEPPVDEPQQPEEPQQPDEPPIEEPVVKVTLTFKLENGEKDIVLEGIVGYDIENLPQDPTRKDYQFIGWNPEVPKTFPKESATYTAKWEAIIVDPPSTGVDVELPFGGISIGLSINGAIASSEINKVEKGSKVRFSVNNLSGTHTYQWYIDSAAVSGATSANYTWNTENVQTGSYNVMCVVDGKYSVYATVTVANVALKLFIDGKDTAETSVPKGKDTNLNFSIRNALAEHTYKWFVDDVEQAGEVSSEFTLNTKDFSPKAHKVRCEIDGKINCSATVNVFASFFINGDPVNTAIIDSNYSNNDNVGFNVALPDYDDHTYRWYVDDEEQEYETYSSFDWYKPSNKAGEYIIKCKVDGEFNEIYTATVYIPTLFVDGIDPTEDRSVLNVAVTNGIEKTVTLTIGYLPGTSHTYKWYFDDWNNQVGETDTFVWKASDYSAKEYRIMCEVDDDEYFFQQNMNVTVN